MVLPAACYVTQVNVPRHNSSPQAVVLDLSTLEGWKAELTWWQLHTEML